jgi:protein SCO1
MSRTPRAPRLGRARGRTIFFGLVACVVVIVGTTVFLPTVIFPPEIPKLDDHGELPGFYLTDHTGAVLTRESLLGHVTIVNFIFTRCDTVCPITSMKMRTIQERTGDATEIKLISISVDPEHDTVPVLADYATRWRADPSRWRFVRGDITAVRALVERGMQIGFDDLGETTASGAPNITHSGHFVLIDQTGHIRGYYDSDDWPRVERLMKHARYLVRRPPDR